MVTAAGLAFQLRLGYTLRNSNLGPMKMRTRCSKVIFPNYSKKKLAEDRLLPPPWGTREICLLFRDYLFTLLYAAELALSR